MIVVDSREPDAIKKILRREGVKYRTKKLPAFDYIINDKIGIERKCFPDLVGSVVTRRLYSQLDKMIGSEYRPFMLIEGEINDSYKILQYSQIKGDCKEIARKGIVRIAVNYGVPTVYSANMYETVEMLKLIQDNDTKFVGKIVKPSKKLNSSAKVLCLIDGIGEQTAVKITTQCGTNLSKYTMDNLKKVTGIGYKTADKVLKFIGDIVG